MFRYGGSAFDPTVAYDNRTPTLRILIHGGLKRMMRPRDEEFLNPQDLDLGSLLQGVRDAVIVAEASTGRIVYWNPAA